MATLITIKNLKLMLKDHIYLDIPKFTIPKGSFYCLVGESGGGGKSLLAKSILGIQDNEFKITGVVENFSRQSDLILQNASDNLQLYWSVGKQAHHLLKSRFKLSKKERENLIRKSLSEVGFSDVETILSKKSHELSGGTCQRVGLALSFLLQSDFLVADEPTSALDEEGKQQILNLLKQQNDLGKTILFITHDLELAYQFGTHLAILRTGKIVERGLIKNIIKQPEDDYTKELISYFEL